MSRTGRALRPGAAWTAAAFVLAALLPSCGGRRVAGVDPGRPITIGVPETASAALPAVALLRNHFEEEGVRVRLEVFDSGRAALTEMLAGKLDFAVSAETPILRAVLAGKKPLIVATVGTRRGSVALIGRKDRGIFTPDDLAGKTVGVVQNTSTEFFLDRFFTANGVPWYRVTEKYMSPTDLLTAILQGQVDAASLWQPHVRFIQDRLGDEASVFDGDVLYIESMHLSGREEFIRDHPEATRAVLRALARAEHDALGAGDRLIADVATALQLNPADTREIWDDLSLAASLDQALISLLDEQAEWANAKYKLGLTRLPDFLDYLYWDGLGTVDPESLTIVRPNPLS